MIENYDKKIISISDNNFDYTVNVYDKDKLKLYRYRSFNEFSLSEVINSEMILSSPNTFNDPYDSSFILSELPQQTWSFDIVVPQKDKPVTKYKTKGPVIITQRGKEFFSKPIISRFKDTVRVACLTTNISSEVMWAHYANRGTGFALEYSYKQIEEYIAVKKLEMCFLLPVFYQNRKLIFPMVNKENVDEIYEKYIKQGLILKNEDWQYENEWRLIYCVVGDEKLISKEFISFQDLTPQRIYLGENIPNSYEKILEDLAEKKNIVVKRMYTSSVDNTKKLSF